MLDWLIIGGGIHGTHLAISLKAAGVRNLRILDPHPELLANWKRCTRDVGMQYLRSPRVHHIGVEPFALQQYIDENGEANYPYRHPNRRPSLALFNAYADVQIRRYSLTNHHIPETACGIERKGRALKVETPTRAICSRNVLFACGRCGQLLWPDWALPLKENGGAVGHALDDNEQSRNAKKGQHIVVGAGQSGAQLALALAEKNPGNVTLITRSALKKSHYDTPPGWMGPKYLHRFYREKSYGRRRAMINEARTSGTMTPDRYRSLMHAIDQQTIKHVTSEVTEAVFFTPQLMMLKLQNGTTIGANQIHLATGFTSMRPGGSLITKLIEDMGLRCAACGFPIAGTSLEWGPGIYVTGALAELELGPAAQNIIGARHAAERIGRSIK